MAVPRSAQWCGQRFPFKRTDEEPALSLKGIENNVGTRGQTPLPLHWDEGRTRQICYSLTGTA